VYKMSTDIRKLFCMLSTYVTQGMDRGLFDDAIPIFAWGDWKKPRNPKSK